MSARPGNWQLLGVDGDPLPGEAYDVASEATHYDNTAQAIRDQVSRLRAIADGSNELVGKYAPALKDSAKELADKLDDTQGRFDTVAQQLKIWSPVLSDGMSRSASMLAEAETAQASIDANQAPNTPVDPKNNQAVADDKARSNRLSDAQGDLSNVQGRFTTMMEAVNATADSVAKAISSAVNDSLKDSWWDRNVRDWIKDNANLLKFIADVLTWIATAIIIVVLIVGTGGIGLAMLLTAGALLIHTMLAANGNGSWTDVAIDAFALVTMGAGKVLSGGAKTMLALREGGGAFAETSTAARAAFTESSGFVSKATTWISRSNPVFRFIDSTAAGMGKFGEVMNAEFKGGRLIDVLTMGEKESAGLYKAIGQSIDKFGPGFLLNSAKGMMNATRITFTSGLLTDVGFKTLNPAFPQHLVRLPYGDGSTIKPPLSNWSKWAEDHTVPHGGYW